MGGQSTGGIGASVPSYIAQNEALKAKQNTTPTMASIAPAPISAPAPQFTSQQIIGMNNGMYDKNGEPYSIINPRPTGIAAKLGLGGNNTLPPTPTIPTINSFDYSAVDEMLARARQQATQRYVPSIEDLFPQLASSQYLQGQDLQPTQQNINPYAQYNMLQGEQTAPAPVSSGAGRFMGTTK